MIAIILVAAGLVFALLYVPKRTGVNGEPANKKPNTEPPERQRQRALKSFEEQLREAIANIKPQKKPNTDPFELQRERSMERSSGLDHDAGKADTNYLDDKRTKAIKRSNEIIEQHARLS